MAERSNPSPDSKWIQGGRGIGPSVKWTFGTEGDLTGLGLARESGDVLASDETGGLYRLDRQGQYAAVTRAREPINAIAVSDDAETTIAIVGGSSLHCFDRSLKTRWQLDLPSDCLSVAIDPFGQYIAVGLGQEGNVIYDVNKRRIVTFESIRPLSYIQFLVTEPELVAAADHGLLCCYNLQGERLWEEKIWSNVGGIASTGDGSLTYVSTYSQGVQVFDEDGETVGTYVVEGTAKKIAASYEPYRICTATLERNLYLLDPDGEMLWAAETPHDVVSLACDPLGDFILVGFTTGHVVCLDWSRN